MSEELMSEQGHKVNLNLCLVDWAPLGRGTWIILCWANNCVAPIGHVIFSSVGPSCNTGKDRIDVLDSDVAPWARRQGVRTWLQHQMFQHFTPSVITTQQGTLAGEGDGELWMRARGYLLNEELGFWWTNKEMFEASLTK